MTKTPIDEDIAAFRGLLHDTLGQSISGAQQIHFDSQNPQHLLTISLYATIIQSAHDCSILLGEETVTIVGGALRSIVESWADLTSMHLDAKTALKATTTRSPSTRGRGTSRFRTKSG